jgi:hypothetical protein
MSLDPENMRCHKEMGPFNVKYRHFESEVITAVIINDCEGGTLVN